MTETLADIAQALVLDGKGILAADESTGTIKKRFDSIATESTDSSRRDYRELLFRAPDIDKYISGVILYDETLRQTAADGTPLAKVLQDQGIIPGIKVDLGAKALAGHPGETITEGLDGLRDRLNEYASLGAKFTKWRGVYHITDESPSFAAIHANAHALARYAALAQEAGMVPIVEPEILMDGEHDINVCQAVSEEVLRSVFAELANQEVELEGILLKPNMVISGQDCPDQNSIDEVAERTLDTLKRCVPAAVPGIVFLSGGQSDELATAHLDAMNKLGHNLPWKLSFSYGRALQAAPLLAWGGKSENATAMQAAFIKRAEDNSKAATGTYA
ncbi:class I fructose-bisphosphate aldolase [Kiloniella laminariae]|uniref:class I fructose-bisphosphate aldolase n=1 Tax=Kiloniella laminariae TaxID=454162 RepID=UPI00037B2E13|nr:class I fructose-bisphosphate aldolase [Kiloniella laminariae]